MPTSYRWVAIVGGLFCLAFGFWLVKSKESDYVERFLGASCILGGICMLALGTIMTLWDFK